MTDSKKTGTDPNPGKDMKLSDEVHISLKDLLQKRLLDCGWRSNVQKLVQQTILDRGVDNLSLDELAAEIVPQARASIPEDIRKEMIIRVRNALESSLPPEKK
ncbi:hypothetical protein KR074_003473 [Drosophila pseudoananassae]|nr:hypothetical protein KR074_003473 [Drosophila pseudoananassae]